MTDGTIETTLRVWVPAGHVERTWYGHDGQNLFNPRGPWEGWGFDAAVDSNWSCLASVDTS